MNVTFAILHWISISSRSVASVTVVDFPNKTLFRVTKEMGLQGFDINPRAPPEHAVQYGTIGNR